MTTLRILADDLTGALDTAAQFADGGHPLPVRWNGPLPAAGSLAIDAATRDGDARSAIDAQARWAPLFDGADIAFKKIDSLLRGHTVAEIAACWGGGHRRCVVAPAFPQQGRITRGGVQHVRSDAGWRPVAPPLHEALAALGLPARLAGRADRIDADDGIVVCDAEEPADLTAIVARVRDLGGPVLWCGTGGLASALSGRASPRVAMVPGPLLAVIGSHHPVSREQVRAVAGSCLLFRLSPGFDPAATARAVTDHLGDGRRVLVTFGLPTGTAPPDAARFIAASVGDLASRSPPPGTLVASGGETLRALADAVGSDGLTIVGEADVGVPVSRMVGGRWDGVTVVSKSGAFGGPDTLKHIVGLPFAAPTAS